jgi:hypothetical protein
LRLDNFVNQHGMRDLGALVNLVHMVDSDCLQ